MPEAPDDLLTLDELCERVGMSVRNVRFYTSRGLVPPPIRKGRSGYYSRLHVGRLELVQANRGGWQGANAQPGRNLNEITPATPDQAEQVSGMSWLEGFPVEICAA